MALLNVFLSLSVSRDVFCTVCVVLHLLGFVGICIPPGAAFHFASAVTVIRCSPGRILIGHAGDVCMYLGLAIDLHRACALSLLLRWVSERVL